MAEVSRVFIRRVSTMTCGWRRRVSEWVMSFTYPEINMECVCPFLFCRCRYTGVEGHRSGRVSSQGQEFLVYGNVPNPLSPYGVILPHSASSLVLSLDWRGRTHQMINDRDLGVRVLERAPPQLSALESSCTSVGSRIISIGLSFQTPFLSQPALLPTR